MNYIVKSSLAKVLFYYFFLKKINIKGCSIDRK